MKPGPRSLAILVALVLAAGAGSQWWHARSEAELGRQLAGAARAGDIRMLSSLTCAFCTRARHWMTERGVAFDECMIERDAQCNLLYQATQARGTPTLLVRGQAQLGFDPARVLEALTAVKPAPRAPA